MPDQNLVDIFSGDAFAVRALTDAINNVPPMYQKVNDLGLFQEKPVETTLVTVEIHDGVLNLIPSSDRGTPAPKNKSAKRVAKHFEIPRYALDDMILPSDIQNVRQFGNMNLKTPESVTAEKLIELSNKHDLTDKFLKVGALCGLVVDSAGVTILDIYAAFGKTQKVVNIDFSSTTGSVRTAFSDIKRTMQKALRGDTMKYVHALCSPGYFDKLITAADLKDAYANYMNNQATMLGMGISSANPLRDDVRSGFVFDGIFFEEYIGAGTVLDKKGAATTTDFIPDDTARFFPVGTTQTFREYQAPADWMETVNTPGLKKYAKVVPELGGRYVEVLSQSNTLQLCLRPDVLIKGTHS